jgi:hypothetical protein
MIQCDIDFNNNGVFPEDQDVVDFFNVLAGAECPSCDSIDINGDSVFPSDEDVEAFFACLAGSPSPTQYFISPDGRDVPGCGSRDNPCGSVRFILGDDDHGIRRNSHTTIWVLPGTYLSGLDSLYGSLFWGGISESQPLTIAAHPTCGTERPVFLFPNLSSALISNQSHVRIVGLSLQGTNNLHGPIISLQGSASDWLISDCIISEGNGGILIQGLGSIARDITVDLCIIQDQRSSVSHAQGIYTSNADEIVIQRTVLWNTGNRDTYSQGMYLVHGPFRRKIHDVWIGEPGFAGIQARGGEFEISYVVTDRCGNGIGVGHPMARPPINSYLQTTTGSVSNILILNPKFPFWGMAMQNMERMTISNVSVVANNQSIPFLVNGPNISGTVRGLKFSGALNHGIDAEVRDLDLMLPERIQDPDLVNVNWPALLGRGRGQPYLSAKEFIDEAARRLGSGSHAEESR